MKAVALYEAKNRLSELVALVESGQDIAITRRGRIVARLTSAEPAKKESQRAEVTDAFRQLRRLRGTIALEGDIKQIARDGLD